LIAAIMLPSDMCKIPKRIEEAATPTATVRPISGISESENAARIPMIIITIPAMLAELFLLYIFLRGGLSASINRLNCSSLISIGLTSI
jgi:hypothetical protein